MQRNYCECQRAEGRRSRRDAAGHYKEIFMSVIYIFQDGASRRGFAFPEKNKSEMRKKPASLSLFSTEAKEVVYW